MTRQEQRGQHRGPARPGDAVQLWDLASRRRVALLRHHGAAVTELALARGALASGSWDWSVALTRGEHTARLRQFSQIITGLSFSPEGRTLAVAAWTEHRSSAPSCLLVRY